MEINSFSGAEKDPARREQNTDKVYQVALLQSLTQGYYDGFVKVGELARHGDTGIGTFDGVEGEMIVLDGTVYQALADGSVREADENGTVPFSVVKFFEKDLSVTLPRVNCFDGLTAALDKTVAGNGKNFFYMVRIDGRFGKMRVRSVPKQKKPFRTLDRALETDQKVFELEDLTGTVVALYCPGYMGALNAPGWHAHFISDDRTKGGHVLDLAFDSARAEFDAARGFELRLPDAPAFQELDLSKDMSAAIKKVETNG